MLDFSLVQAFNIIIPTDMIYLGEISLFLQRNEILKNTLTRLAFIEKIWDIFALFSAVSHVVFDLQLR